MPYQGNARARAAIARARQREQWQASPMHADVVERRERAAEINARRSKLLYELQREQRGADGSTPGKCYLYEQPKVYHSSPYCTLPLQARERYAPGLTGWASCVDVLWAVQMQLRPCSGCVKGGGQ